MMRKDRFWEIIDTSRQRAVRKKRRPIDDFIHGHEEALAEDLLQLSPREIVSFDQRFWHYHQLAYRWDLWAAAYWLGGGCSDDGFTDFRSCLISLGKDLFTQVLEGPDELADIVSRPDVPYMQAEGFQYVASKVYREKTGEDIPRPRRGASGPREPVGKRIDHDNEEEMRRHFPKLVAKFPEMGD